MIYNEEADPNIERNEFKNNIDLYVDMGFDIVELKKQKAYLLLQDQSEEVNGLIELIDNIQDAIMEQNEFSENHVFDMDGSVYDMIERKYGKAKLNT